MGRVKRSVASQKSKGPVILHLDPAIAHELLHALTQALEPHPTNAGKLGKNLLEGGRVKGAGVKAKNTVHGSGAKRKSSKGKSPRRKAAKGKGAKKSR